MKIIKKHLKLLIFIIVCLLVFIIYNKTNNNYINYTSIGDGFSLGKDSYGQIDYGYSDYVKDYLKNNHKLNRYIKSFSKEEMSIEKLYEYILINEKVTLNDKQYNIRETLRESRILTISIGLNDLLYQLSITNNITDRKLDQIISKIELSLDKLLIEIKKYYHYDIYIIGYYDIDPSNELLSKAIKRLNKIYQNKEKVIYISTYELFQKDNDYLSNPSNIYPNRSGYQAISQEIILKISKKLEN